MKTVFLVTSAIVILIALLFFLGFYERFLLYYEETTSNRIADAIIGLIFTSFLTFSIVTGWRTSLKRNQLKVLSFLKEVLVTIAIMLFIHFVYIRPVLSGFIQFINTNVGRQSSIQLKGTVSNVWIRAGKAAQYEITLETKDYGQLVLDTDKRQIESYKTGDIFNKQLSKGCLGLIYLK